MVFNGILTHLFCKQVGVLLICIHELASPFVRGFNCDDETIRYPHKDSTVSSRICYIGGSGINIIFILALEYQLLISQGEQNEPFNAKLYLRNVYCRLIVWFFGAISSELLTDISKVTAGRLRPHFIDVCKPVIVLGQNKEASLDDYCASSNQRYQYITDYYCSGDPAKIRDTRLSFMSGHSSYSAYSAAFAVVSISTIINFQLSSIWWSNNLLIWSIHLHNLTCCHMENFPFTVLHTICHGCGQGGPHKAGDSGLNNISIVLYWINANIWL